MEFLKAIQEQTERMVQELAWTEDEVADLVAQVNGVMASNKDTGSVSNDIHHAATYEGGFILFGGWTRIFDSTIPKGRKGHQLYLAFGGLGAGGWKGKCDLFTVNNTSFEEFHNTVKSFMFMYWPVFEQEIPIFVFFTKNSKRIGVAIPEYSISCGMGGGTVEVMSK